MTRTHKTLSYTTIFFVSLIAITWLALTPHSPRILEQGIDDKLQHVTAFGWLMLLANCSFPRASAHLSALALLGYGILIEVAQYFIPQRTASASDILADLAGIGIALLLLRYARAPADCPPPT